MNPLFDDKKKHADYDPVVRMLLGVRLDSRADINSEGSLARPVLHTAAAEGLLALLELACDHRRAQVDLFSAGVTPLHRACTRGHATVVHALLKRGASANLKTTPDGDSSLHLASKLGSVECVRIVVTEGRADVFATNGEGRTALHIACKKGNVSIVQFLVTHVSSADYLDFKTLVGNTGQYHTLF